jgi:hypothetical protein
MLNRRSLNRYSSCLSLLNMCSRTPKVSLPGDPLITTYLPLISGAQPVNIRVYRFSPAMKDGVESQVQEMI